MLLILITWEAEIRRIVVQAQPRQIDYGEPISISSWVWWLTPVIPGFLEAENKRIEVP
jgi:hypothetical protein